MYRKVGTYIFPHKLCGGTRELLERGEQITFTECNKLREWVATAMLITMDIVNIMKSKASAHARLMKETEEKQDAAAERAQASSLKAARKALNRVVLYVTDLHGAGGLERLLWEEEKFFRQKGVEMIVLTFSFDKSALYDYQPHLEIIEAGSSRLSRALALRRKLRELNPDLVIAQSHGCAMYLYLATLFTPIPYAVHVHGTFFWAPEDRYKYALVFRRVFSKIRESVAGHKEFVPPYPHNGLKKRIASEFLAILNYLAIRRAQKTIVLTEQVRWEVEKLYGKDSVIARGCLPSEALNYQPKQNIRQRLGLEGQRIIFNVGRLDPLKRIDLLIKACAKIFPQYPDVYLVIGGTGEDEERLKGLAEELGIKERVKFVGFISDPELFDYHAACDVFAFPSWTTSGISPYEALAVNKKVVWTTEADEPVLGDKHVFLAHPTVEDFAKGLEKALNTPVEGEIDLSDYTWDRYFETVYNAAIEAVNRQ